MAEDFLITINHSVPFLGKAWCVSMLLLRLLLVILAASSLFGAEHESVLCNTIQPGCSSVCFDLFAPVSVLRLWLFQLLFLSLPHLIFASYVLHGAARRPRCAAAWGRGGSPYSLETASSSSKAPLPQQPPSFHCSYLLVVLLRLLLEVLFSAAQFFLFGLSVPKSFLCYEAPCTSGVECYISRPTEKSLMLGFMLAAASTSILLSLMDLLSSVKAMLRWSRRRQVLVEELSKGEQSSVFTGSVGEDTDVLLSRRTSPSGTSKTTTAPDHKHAGLFLPQEKHTKPPLTPLAHPPAPTQMEADPGTANHNLQPGANETKDRRAWV